MSDRQAGATALEPFTVIPVATAGRPYEVFIGPAVLGRGIAQVPRLKPKARVAIITDATVNAAHGAALDQALADAGLTCAGRIVLPPGERSKSWEGLKTACEGLIAAGLERADLVIAFGGGVIGDLAGLAAGLVKRGLDFVQIPTTLLAQVDSSVGGKTAIDVAAGKNLVGLFHQPILVIADTALLATLPARELRAGFAEVLKYGLIDDPAFFAWSAGPGLAAAAGDPAALTEAVARSVAAKARIVALDEREAGPRALLNLGHTFAHALETEAGFEGALLHGEAVGAGLGLAFALSARLGLAPHADADAVDRALAAVGLERRLNRLGGAPFAADRLLAAMAHDKKNENGRLTLILARGIGQAFIRKDADPGAVRALLEFELGNRS